MKLFGSTKKLIDETKNGENVPSLEVVEVEVLYTVTPNKTMLSWFSVWHKIWKT